MIPTQTRAAAGICVARMGVLSPGLAAPERTCTRPAWGRYRSQLPAAARALPSGVGSVSRRCPVRHAPASFSPSMSTSTLTPEPVTSCSPRPVEKRASAGIAS